MSTPPAREPLIMPPDEFETVTKVASRLGMRMLTEPHLAAIRRALVVAISETQYEAEAKPYREALKALSDEEVRPGGC